jgi:hypothetical protein
VITIVGVPPALPGITAFIESAVICQHRPRKQRLKQAIDKCNKQTKNQQAAKSSDGASWPQRHKPNYQGEQH